MENSRNRWLFSLSFSLTERLCNHQLISASYRSRIRRNMNCGDRRNFRSICYFKLLLPSLTELIFSVIHQHSKQMTSNFSASCMLPILVPILQLHILTSSSFYLHSNIIIPSRPIFPSALLNSDEHFPSC